MVGVRNGTSVSIRFIKTLEIHRRFGMFRWWFVAHGEKKVSRLLLALGQEDGSHMQSRKAKPIVALFWLFLTHLGQLISFFFQFYGEKTIMPI